MLNISNTVSPQSKQLLDVITIPDKLANDLSAIDLISVSVKNIVLYGSFINCHESIHLDVSIHDNL